MVTKKLKTSTQQRPSWTEKRKIIKCGEMPSVHQQKVNTQVMLRNLKY